MAEEAKKRSNNLVRNLILLLILVLLLLGAGFLLTRNKNNDQTAQQQPEADLNAVLSVLEGTPQFKKAGSDTYNDGTEGTGLDKGDTLKTDAKSRALILFADNSSVSLDYSTTVTLTEIPTSEGGNVNLLQEAGNAWHRVEKLSGSNTYQVQTPTTIAAVRGTKFISAVNSPDSTNIHTVESVVNVTPFIDGEKLDSADVTAGKWVDILKSKKGDYSKKGNFKNFIFDFTQQKSKWFRFNECIDQFVPDALKDTKGKMTLRQRFQIIRDKLKALQDCTKILGESTTATPTVTLTPTPKAASLKYVNAKINSSNKLTCDWDANGSDISGYQYSAGDGSGKTNLQNWTNTNGKSATINKTLTNYKKYYCNVKVFSKWGDGQKSSGPVYFDPSNGKIITASMYDSNPCSPFAVCNNVNMSGYASFADMNSGDAIFSFYIKRSNGQYLNAAGNWQAGQFWFSTTTSLDGYIYFNGPATPGNTVAVLRRFGSKLHVEFKNKISGKLLNTWDQAI